MHDFDRVVGIFLTFEFDEPESLMFITDFISGNMNLNNRSTLSKQLP